MVKREFRCGEYRIELERDGETLEIVAHALNGGQSTINTVNGIMGAILTDDQSASTDFDDTPWVFASPQEAMAAFDIAVDLFENHPEMVEDILDEDRREGEWGFPSDKAAAPDAHLEQDYEDRVSGPQGPWGEEQP